MKKFYLICIVLTSMLFMITVAKSYSYKYNNTRLDIVYVAGHGAWINGSQTFIGRSVTNPCSDMTLADIDTHPFVIEDFFYVTEFDFSNGYFWGVLPGVTCKRVDMYANEKIYTTGNVKFTWENERIVNVSPNDIILDFTNK